MSRAVRAAYWLTPIAFCLALYWLGLRCWFQMDDFAWLNLRNLFTDFHSFLAAMFAPMAQGTIRPLSERGFFMVFSGLSGLHPLPYRLFVFLNQSVNILLVMLVTRKLTKSALAGFLAPLLWLVNTSLVTPMTWTSAYNEIQWATFLLLSFYLFLRYTETGERRFYWAQWLTFVLGFGSLEINVVYPAVAALYAVIFARRYWLSTLPMFVASAAFAVAHRLASSNAQGFYYDMDFHVRSLLNVLWQYWNILLGVPGYVHLRGRPVWWGYAAVLLLTSAILGFAAWQAWKRRFLPLFWLGWFLIILSPLLPLHNHVTDYYVHMPAIGIAMLAAYAIALAWQRGWTRAALAAALALLYMVPSAIAGRIGVRYNFDHGDRVRVLIQSVAYAKRIHPGKTILLKDVDDELFWDAIYDSPFHIFGWNDVFVTPDSRPKIQADPHAAPIDTFFLPESAVVRVLNEGGAVVYTVEHRSLRNITRPYTSLIDAQPEPPLASSIDLGTPYFKDQLGDGWYSLEDGFRWSSKHAVVYLRGPTAPGQKLAVHGNATENQLKHGPLRFALTINGREQPVKVIDPGNPDFRLEYDLPPGLVGQPKIEVAFTLDRAFRVDRDVRELGIAFGDFSIK